MYGPVRTVVWEGGRREVSSLSRLGDLMRYNRLGFWMTPQEWWKHRKVILNARLWNKHLQVWCFSWRIMKPESRRNRFKLWELFIWRAVTREEAIRFGFFEERATPASPGAPGGTPHA